MINYYIIPKSSPLFSKLLYIPTKNNCPQITNILNLFFRFFLDDLKSYMNIEFQSLDKTYYGKKKMMKKTLISRAFQLIRKKKCNFFILQMPISPSWPSSRRRNVAAKFYIIVANDLRGTENSPKPPIGDAHTSGINVEPVRSQRKSTIALWLK